MADERPHCVKCSVLRCGSKDKTAKLPASCPTEKYADLARRAVEEYRTPENRAINQGWLGVMGRVLDPEKQREKWSWTRVDEVMEYAKVRKMRRLGIATCYSLIPESRALSDILEENGFEVVSVSCLCGETSPQDIGLPGEITCNSILQAEVLNHEETDLNIMMGLCIGHDILFLRHSEAETTPLVVKDRALGHNPAAALYQSQGFFGDRYFDRRA
jgi:uncharacterized metal-binding protein